MSAELTAEEFSALNRACDGMVLEAESVREERGAIVFGPGTSRLRLGPYEAPPASYYKWLLGPAK